MESPPTTRHQRLIPGFDEASAVATVFLLYKVTFLEPGCRSCFPNFLGSRIAYVCLPSSNQPPSNLDRRLHAFLFMQSVTIRRPTSAR
jgi:hypothetical protein